MGGRGTIHMDNLSWEPPLKWTGTRAIVESTEVG